MSVISAADIALKLGRATQCSNGWKASCPVPNHGKGLGDRNPSLSITDTDDGRVLVFCHAGCEQGAVISALKHRDLWPATKRGLATRSQIQISASELLKS